MYPWRRNHHHIHYASPHHLKEVHNRIMKGKEDGLYLIVFSGMCRICILQMCLDAFTKHHNRFL